MKENLEIHIGNSLRGDMKAIEFIIGKDKLEESYRNNPKNISNFINSELSEYLSKEKIEQLMSSIRKEASIEYYKKDEQMPEISSRSIVEELCTNVHEKRKDEPVDLAEALSSYVVLEVDEGKNVNFYRNLYDIFNGMLEKLELVIGRENIQKYYNNGKLEDLRQLIKQNLSKEEYKMLQDGRNDQEILMKLCKNIGQENLADIISNMDAISEGNGLSLHLLYREHKLVCNYYNQGLSLYEEPIDRKELLRMDYASFRKFLDEKAVEREKKEKETSEKTISLEELVKPTMELLKEGSEGSKVCDDVEEEINGLISEKNVDKDSRE